MRIGWREDRDMQTIDRIDDWAAAVDNRAAVPEHETRFAEWRARAAAFRASHAPDTRPYGEAEREAFDLWMPEGPPKGLAVFIHGGWWMNFDKSCFSHLAAGPIANGWAVAIPSYTLLPDITLTGLVQQVRGAVNAVARAVPDVPLVLSGHSAGGHLAALCGTDVAGLEEDVHARLVRIVSISGLHDLRPLRPLPINETLGITTAESYALSPALHTPRPGFDLVAWVGARETPEFRRQNALLGIAWGGYATTRSVEAEDLDHFTVIAPLADPESALTRMVVAEGVAARTESAAALPAPLLLS